MKHLLIAAGIGIGLYAAGQWMAAEVRGRRKPRYHYLSISYPEGIREDVTKIPRGTTPAIRGTDAWPWIWQEEEHESRPDVIYSRLVSHRLQPTPLRTRRLFGYPIDWSA